jgi:MOSC domain-containing protein YiiM
MSTPATLLSVQVGQPRTYGYAGAADPMDRPWASGFFKRPVAGPVHVGRTNVAGDGQADLRNHGGPDKSVLAYAAAHYDLWRRELGLPDMPYGGFGENFTVSGLTEPEVCVGDTYRIGDRVLVQVSQPRQPCWKLGRRWRLADLPGRVVENGRSGWYFRVLHEGIVEAGMPLVLRDRPHPQWTVARANDVLYRGTDDPRATLALAGCPLLSHGWRDYLRSRVANAGG